jgi:hypothetical protein
MVKRERDELGVDVVIWFFFSIVCDNVMHIVVVFYWFTICSYLFRTVVLPVVM